MDKEEGLDKIAYTDRVKRTWVTGANPIGAPKGAQTHQESLKLTSRHLN